MGVPESTKAVDSTPRTSLRERTVSGLGWNGAAQLCGAALQFVVSIILARLLSPKDFGLIGMVLVFAGFASSLSEMGLGASLVQHRTASARHLNAAFWANVAAGTFLTILFGLLAPLIAQFYQEPLLRWLTPALACNLLFSSLNVVQNALLVKTLDFRTKFWMSSISLAVSGIVGILMAFSGAGVWSLVAQALALTAMQVALMWCLSSWRPAFSFDWPAFRELMRFGGNLTASTIFHYWGRHVDKLIIGRLLGSAPLGIYTLADKLMRLPVTNATDIASAVMFPALATIQEDVQSVKRTYLRATRMLALVTFPMMMGLVVLAEPAIQCVYGDKWRGAIGIVQLLCFAGMAQSIYFTGGWVFLSQGRTDIVLRFSIYTTLVRVIGVLVGAHWGLVGVAWSYVLGTYVFILYPAWSCAGRLINLGFRQLLANLAGPFACSASMGLLVWISDHWVFGHQPSALRLVAQVPLGVLIYVFLNRHFRVQAFVEAQQVLSDMGGLRSRFSKWLFGSA